MNKSQFEKDFETFEKELFSNAEVVMGWKYDENGEVIAMSEQELTDWELDTEGKED